MSDAWYLEADAYYVPAANADEYPLRQGDLIPGHETAGEEWLAAQIVHPTCELSKPTVKEIQVVRVRPLPDLPGDFDRALVVSGFSEKDGHRRVAVAHTFFLPPWEGTEEAWFANFREIATVDRESITQEERLAAMTHDCRVTFIRRWLYFRFRLSFSLDQVHNWEAQRISNDPNFGGPRPPWGEPPA